MNQENLVKIKAFVRDVSRLAISRGEKKKMRNLAKENKKTKGTK